MGKKNSKLKQDTIDRLTTDTYCKYTTIINIFIFIAIYNRKVFYFFKVFCVFSKKKKCFAINNKSFSLCMTNNMDECVLYTSK